MLFWQDERWIIVVYLCTVLEPGSDVKVRSGSQSRPDRGPRLCCKLK
jgi:hypothetical protein